MGIWVRNYRSRNDSRNSCFWSPPQHWWHPPRARNLRYTTQSSDNSAGWVVSFTSDSVSINFFQAAWLVSTFYRQVVLSQSLHCSFAHLRMTPSHLWTSLFVLERQGIGESNRFQEVPETIFSCSPSVIRSFSLGWNASNLKKTPDACQDDCIQQN